MSKSKAKKERDRPLTDAEWDEKVARLTEHMKSLQLKAERVDTLEKEYEKLSVEIILDLLKPLSPKRRRELVEQIYVELDQ